MNQLCGAWAASYSRECNEKFQTAQEMWNKFPVSCYAGKYLSPFCICTGTGILGTTVWTSSDGAGCGWHFF